MQESYRKETKQSKVKQGGKKKEKELTKLELN